MSSHQLRLAPLAFALVLAVGCVEPSASYEITYQDIGFGQLSCDPGPGPLQPGTDRPRLQEIDLLFDGVRAAGIQFGTSAECGWGGGLPDVMTAGHHRLGFRVVKQTIRPTAYGIAGNFIVVNVTTMTARTFTMPPITGTLRTGEVLEYVFDLDF